MKIDWDKPLVTNEGHKARLLTSGLHGEFSRAVEVLIIAGAAEGRLASKVIMRVNELGMPCFRDLWSVEGLLPNTLKLVNENATRTIWIPVLNDTLYYYSREDALNAHLSSFRGLLACVPVTFVPGDGLETHALSGLTDYERRLLVDMTLDNPKMKWGAAMGVAMKTLKKRGYVNIANILTPEGIAAAHMLKTNRW